MVQVTLLAVPAVPLPVIALSAISHAFSVIDYAALSSFMRTMTLLPPMAIAASLSGCSVHPLPDTATRGLETYRIVQKLRCEAQEAVATIYEGSAAPSLYSRALKKLKGHSSAEKLQRQQREKNYKAATKAIERARNDRKTIDAEGERLAEKRASLQTRESMNELKVLKIKDDLLREANVRKARRPKTELDETIDREIETKAKAALAEIEADRQRIATAIIQFKIDVLAHNAKLAASNKSIAVLEKARRAEFGDILKYLGNQFTMQVKFSITEKNTGKADGSLKFPILLGSLTIDPSIGDERERLGERIIKIAVDFEDFVKDGRRDNGDRDREEPDGERNPCDAFQVSEAPFGGAPRYPITGRVGLAEAIEQYLRVAEHADEVFPKGAKAGSEAYTDKIQFKTTISAGVKPKITITPAAGHSLTGNFDLSGSRIDLHEVFIGLYQEKAEDGSEADKITKVQIIRQSDY